MAAKTSEWRPGPTVCRCCLSEGCYKDISTEYFWMGKREVYAEMLADTFDLAISFSKSGGPNSQSRLICEPCIARLRDSYDFKRQVQECEKTFVQCLDPVNALADLQVSLELDKDVKIEVVKEEKGHSGDDDEYDDAPDFGDDDDEYDDLDDQPLTKLASKMPKKEEMDVLDLLDNAKITEKRKSSSKIKGQPSKKSKSIKTIATSSKEKPEPKKKKVVLDPSPEEDFQVKQEQIDTLKEELIKELTGELHIGVNISEHINNGEQGLKKKSTTDSRGMAPLLRANSLTLIENSNMFAFQYHKSRYTCFCCNEKFLNLKTLGEHTKKEHNLKILEEKIIRRHNNPLKVEISSLKCKKCTHKFNTLSELRKHLEDKHKIQFENCKDLLVPFKILTEGLKCQICYEDFDVFRLLNIHMNKHYRNHICDVCGSSFSNLAYLNLHKTRSHRNKPFECLECNMVFVNRAAKNQHDTLTHDATIIRKLRFPCQFCNERFYQENFKIQHLVDKHGMQKPEHKCPFCPKLFITRSLCNNHIKYVHFKNKNHECDLCYKVFYTKSDLTRHRAIHTGEKKFLCAVCNGMFSSKDSLRRHVKRCKQNVIE